MFHVLIQWTHINQQLDLFSGSSKERQAAKVKATSFEWSYGDLLRLATLSPMELKNGGLEDDFSLQEQWPSLLWLWKEG